MNTTRLFQNAFRSFYFGWKDNNWIEAIKRYEAGAENADPATAEQIDKALQEAVQKNLKQE